MFQEIFVHFKPDFVSFYNNLKLRVVFRLNVELYKVTKIITMTIGAVFYE